ncbi:MAG: glycosyltransferase family 4 protein [Anaerolineales bacterium]|nr:glycosyltransferase family 4 protein [Anaerolineales bacterium]
MSDVRAANPRVLLLHYTAFPVIGGVEKVMAQHERLLAEDGHPVRVLAGRGDPSSQVILRELDAAHPEVRKVLADLLRGEPAADFAALQRRIREALFPHLEWADVVILHNVMHLHLNLPLTAALHEWLDRRPRKRAISWCHDLSRYIRPSRKSPPKEGFPWSLLKKKRSQVAYAAVSGARRDLLAKTFRCPPESIRIIPNGVDPETLLGLSETGRRIAGRIRWASADLILFMPVRITRAKNIEFALRLTAAVRDAGVEARLVVSGPPDPHAADIRTYVGQIKDLRKNLNLDRAAYFLFEELPPKPDSPGLDDGVMGELYRLCDLMLMPSLREGFGMPVLEAGLAGRAVFASRMPAMENIDPELVHVLDPGGTPEEAARRILDWMAADKEFRLRRSIRRELTWEAVYCRSIRELVCPARETKRR